MSGDSEALCPRGVPLEDHQRQHLFHALRRDRGLYLNLACVARETLDDGDAHWREIYSSAWVPPFSVNGYLPGLDPEVFR